MCFTAFAEKTLKKTLLAQVRASLAQEAAQPQKWPHEVAANFDQPSIYLATKRLVQKRLVARYIETKHFLDQPLQE